MPFAACRLRGSRQQLPLRRWRGCARRDARRGPGGDGVIAARLEREYPLENEHTGATVLRLRDDLPQQSRLLLLALCGAALCILLIACANLANLLLARTLGRQQGAGGPHRAGRRPRAADPAARSPRASLLAAARRRARRAGGRRRGAAAGAAGAGHPADRHTPLARPPRAAVRRGLITALTGGRIRRRAGLARRQATADSSGCAKAPALAADGSSGCAPRSSSPK